VRAGTGCCAGIVHARARVVRDPRKDALERGEVLVARHTDPGWIALFTNAGEPTAAYDPRQFQFALRLKW
jgi:pyruvate,water dikinase